MEREGRNQINMLSFAIAAVALTLAIVGFVLPEQVAFGGSVFIASGSSEITFPHNLGTVPTGFSVTPSWSTILNATADALNITISFATPPDANATLSWIAVK
jgi:hypothetical protein